MLIRKHKLVFVHIPKTGGSSIVRSLKPHRDLRSIASRRLNKTLNSLHIPYRLNGIDTQVHASAQDYADVLGRGFERYFSFAIVRNPFDWMVSLYHFSLKRRKTDVSFRDFVHTCSAKAQADYITDDNGEVIVSFVGRFERLAKDFQAASEKIGLDLHLPHLNATDHEHFSRYYDDETREIVARRYKRDFDIFGYCDLPRDFSSTRPAPLGALVHNESLQV
ncbi:hypothetical protein BMG03_15275 [Thioclava nitratireducens]|uniref:Sulfotransferase family protein n=1 Tax=Thioclava nitratireducens TaxID=1915078 RepID=A0ABM6IJQ1_9RHOB|nr:sulfotransferase family 2 domain-containing protein [Thioclava nitratireducens]AQS48998.1 hypothetical protein BMG03_15275 [Thioclava nitratireducens]